MINCKECWQMKINEQSKKCLCHAKKITGDKLSKKTRKTQQPYEIPKVSKKKEQNKNKWKLSLVFKKIAKKKCDSKWNAVCEYCGENFNIQYDLINQTVCFAHILSRREYKPLELLMNNIAFVCSEKCHKDMDSEICVLKIKKDLEKCILRHKTIDVSNLQKYIS